jgi:hypothetical protein
VARDASRVFVWEGLLMYISDIRANIFSTNSRRWWSRFILGVVVGKEECLERISTHGDDERIESRMGLRAGVHIVVHVVKGGLSYCGFSKEWGLMGNIECIVEVSCWVTFGENLGALWET